MASSCVEGHRKKAKYLLDDEELEQLKSSKSSAPEKHASDQLPPIPTSEPFPTNDPLFNVAFDSNFAFGSEAANLEYSILSAILGNPSPPDSASATAPSPSQPQLQPTIPNSAWSPEPLHAQPHYQPTPQQAYPFAEPTRLSMHEPTLAATAQPSPTAAFITYSPTQFSRPSQDSAADLSYPLPYPQGQSTPSLPPRYSRDPSTSAPMGSVRISSQEAGPLELSGHPSPSSTSSTHQSSLDHLSQLNVTSPYDYTEGYHFLMKHLPTRPIPDVPPVLVRDRFEKNDILRIVRALAIFRPSLIALQMPMTDEDEMFVERCFQRSLIVGRFFSVQDPHPDMLQRNSKSLSRTAVRPPSFGVAPGEICLVAPEFCMLTEWPMEELIGKRKYIYEVTPRSFLLLLFLFTARARTDATLPTPPHSPLLATSPLSLQLFENQSVVEYWENFASHAFENTTKAVYSHCVLLKPSGAPLPATFCFSIRRDIFDLPSIVIGEYALDIGYRSALYFTTADMVHLSFCLAGQWLPLL
ncbi:hypothetical protein JVT61DRAFT_14030 [Boletus reticuloceps]|uniref:ERT1/acuK family PAS domain-containing protein n=1 Tax=Boletus reticuloceps TaxID=495285 RepID=A0A8I2YS41_9AGAM|nr:hypothetical protein JVT61DRAFT_14030 [Boletus reticuloceps]